MKKSKSAKIFTSRTSADSTTSVELIKNAIHNLDLKLLSELLADLEPNLNSKLKHLLSRLPWILPVLTVGEIILLEVPLDKDKTNELESVSHRKQEESNPVQNEIETNKKRLEARRDIAYAVIDLTRDLAENYDEMQSILADGLRAAAKANESILIDALMHSGADLFYQVSNDRTIYDEITSFDISESVTQAIDTLFPGFPQLTRTNSPVHLVRQFINLWVYPPALESVPENNNVIRMLISTQQDTLKLIHAVLANNIRKVNQILTDENASVNVNVRAVDATSGPTILWYVIEKRNVEMAATLVSHGARVDLPVKVGFITAPVIYSALIDPRVDENMMTALLQESLYGCHMNRSKFKELLYRMLFNGKNILEQAIECKLNLPCFKVLLEAVGAKVIADRNSNGRTVRDVVENGLNSSGYCELIDAFVVKCIQNPNDPDRQILALFGYDITSLNMQEPPVDEFYSLYGEYQKNIRNLCQLIDNDELDEFEKLTNYTGKGQFEKLIVWEGREGFANPLPILHRAVVHNRKAFVEKILALKPVGHSIDSLLDHERRTALHYASGLVDSEIRNLLRTYGCSDHVKDRMGRTPLDFKLVREKKSMKKLIGRLRFGDFTTKEPNPWRRIEKMSQLEDLQVADLDNSDEEIFEDDSSDDDDDEDDDEGEDAPGEGDLPNGNGAMPMLLNGNLFRPERWSDYCNVM